ncbi:hypothetical protein Tco_0448873 [Tanacetum coccineum]
MRIASVQLATSGCGVWLRVMGLSKGAGDEVKGMVNSVNGVLLEIFYLDMVARKPRQATTMTDEEGGKKKKAPLAGKSKKPAPAKQPALAK